MKRYDIETKPYHEGASMRVDDYGDWCDAAEALHEIAKRDAEIRYLESQVERWQDAVLELAPDSCYADQIRHEAMCNDQDCEECDDRGGEP